MDIKIIIYSIILFLTSTCAKITVDLNINDDLSNVSLTFSGVDTKVISAQEIRLFNITNHNLKEAVKLHYGKKASNIYLKSPTPWGDLYKTYNWEQVNRVLSIKSARLKNITTKPVVVLSHDFENFSNATIKVNTGISQTVENTLTTSWTKNREWAISQEIEYDVNIVVAKLSGTTGLSYSSSWGESEEKSVSVTIGTTSTVETELKPGQAVTAVLSANRGHFEIEVIYKTTLRGNVAVNFKKPHKGHHFWGPSIENIMKNGNIQSEIITIEMIKVGFYNEASLKVFDKSTGQPL